MHALGWVLIFLRTPTFRLSVVLCNHLSGSWDKELGQALAKMRVGGLQVSRYIDECGTLCVLCVLLGWGRRGWGGGQTGAGRGEGEWRLPRREQLGANLAVFVFSCLQFAPLLPITSLLTAAGRMPYSADNALLLYACPYPEHAPQHIKELLPAHAYKHRSESLC